MPEELKPYEVASESQFVSSARQRAQRQRTEYPQCETTIDEYWLQELDRLRSIIHELKNDTRIVDWIADERLFDGIGNIDIDEVCVSMLPSTVEVDDEIWKLTWRKALRKVILDVMDT